MSEDDRRARMTRMGTSSWRVPLRWATGALVAAVLTTIATAPRDEPATPGPAAEQSTASATDGPVSDGSAPTGKAAPLTFPTSGTAGLPEGWTPKRTHTGDLHLTEPGEVVSDLRITDGIISVEAEDVTLRRVQAVGSRVVNDNGPVCGSGLVVEQSEFVRSSRRTTDGDLQVIGNGGFTVRDVVIDGVPEGIRVGAAQCGDVVVEDTFIRVVPPDDCGDWHGDGIQGYGGGALTVKNTRIIMRETADCYGTAPFFYPSGQGNTSLTVDGLLVEGGGYAFRAGTPGSVRNLQVVGDTWGYGPVDVLCSALSDWQAHTVTVGDGGTRPVDPIACAGSGN
ncbi:hypothetical protein [Promicromonospora sp. NPDC057488]|uniref:hypothetical protein n=1 Tax=Promicromonospora sp. NPDC057488 TaxID=3346147 RepID=UPI00366FDD79